MAFDNEFRGERTARGGERIVGEAEDVAADWLRRVSRATFRARSLSSALCDYKDFVKRSLRW